MSTVSGIIYNNFDNFTVTATEFRYLHTFSDRKTYVRKYNGIVI